MSAGITIAVSSCLLGERVRYDGGHKRHPAIVERLAGAADWLPFCPEVLAGLPVPRPPLQQLSGPEPVRVVEVATGRDHTAALAAAARGIVEQLRAHAVSGVIVKSRSPSCGVGDTPRVDEAGRFVGVGDGAAVAAVRAALPRLPIVTERALEGAAGREAFLARCEAYAAWRGVEADAGLLTAFHGRHRMLLRSRAPDARRALRACRERGDVTAYGDLFFRALQPAPTRRAHEHTLHVCLEHYGRGMAAGARRRAAAAIDAYVNAATPLRAAAAALREVAPAATRRDAYLAPSPAREREYEDL